MNHRFLSAFTASFLLLACAEGDKTPPPVEGVSIGGAAGKGGGAGRSGAAGKAGASAGGAAGSSAGGGTGGAEMGGAAGSSAGAGGAEAGQGGGGAGGSAGGAGASGQAGAAGKSGAAGAAAGSGGSGGAAGSAGAAGQAAGGAGSAGSAGAAGSAGGAGSAGVAGAGGAAAGAAGSGGTAGGGGTAAAGAAGAAGNAGTAGSGGAVGGSGGAGGNPLGPGLVAVALSASGQLVPARLEGFTWKTGTTTETAVGQPVMTTAGAQALLAFRTSAGALRYGVLNGSLGLDGGEIAPASKNGPTLASAGLGARVAFTDASDGLLGALFSAGSGFSAPSKLTSDPGGSTSLAAPTTAAFGATEASVHAGTNEGVYFAPIGGATEAIAGAGSKKDVSPVLAYDKTGRPVVFFVRNTDSQLYVTVRTAAATWTPPTFVAQNAFTDRRPSVARLSGGDLVVSWHGKDNQGIYYARAADAVASWGQPGLVVQEAVPVASSPVVVAADAGSAEILYVRGGVATRARLDGSTVTVSSAFGTGLSEIAGAYLAP